MLRVVLLFAGAALLAALLWQLGPRHVLDTIYRVGWYLLPVLLLEGLFEATRAVALRACVPKFHRLRLRDALAIRLSGEAIQSLTFMGPALSEPAKAWLLERQGLSLKEGMGFSAAAGFAVAFLKRALVLVLASVGLAALARLTQSLQRSRSQA